MAEIAYSCFLLQDRDTNNGRAIQYVPSTWDIMFFCSAEQVCFQSRQSTNLHKFAVCNLPFDFELKTGKFHFAKYWFKALSVLFRLPQNNEEPLSMPQVICTQMKLLGESTACDGPQETQTCNLNLQDFTSPNVHCFFGVSSIFPPMASSMIRYYVRVRFESKWTMMETGSKLQWQWITRLLCFFSPLPGLLPDHWTFRPTTDSDGFNFHLIFLILGLRQWTQSCKARGYW